MKTTRRSGTRESGSTHTARSAASGPAATRTWATASRRRSRCFPGERGRWSPGRTAPPALPPEGRSARPPGAGRRRARGATPDAARARGASAAGRTALRAAPPAHARCRPPPAARRAQRAQRPSAPLGAGKQAVDEHAEHAFQRRPRVASSSSSDSRRRSSATCVRSGSSSPRAKRRASTLARRSDRPPHRVPVPPVPRACDPQSREGLHQRGGLRAKAKQRHRPGGEVAAGRAVVGLRGVTTLCGAVLCGAVLCGAARRDV